MPSSREPLTELLAAVGRGDDAARERLWAVIYDELRNIARRQLAGGAAGHTLQPTTLVHEAYLRLTANEDVHWENRRHFFAAAAQAMRQIRIDDVRKRNRLKRGGGGVAQGGGEVVGRPRGLKPAALQPEDGPAVFDQDPAEVLAVDEALKKLEQADPRKAEVVMLRYFVGLTVQECAEALGLAPRTVEKYWQFARIWLYRELK